MTEGEAQCKDSLASACPTQGDIAAFHSAAMALMRTAQAVASIAGRCSCSAVQSLHIKAVATLNVQRTRVLRGLNTPRRALQCVSRQARKRCDTQHVVHNM